jgi:thymidine kinase
MPITFCTGLMGAGKSKKLIDDYLLDNSKKVALAVHLSKKTGEDIYIKSRSGDQILGTCLNYQDFEGIRSLLKSLIIDQIESFYIDEIQFLSQQIIEYILELEKEHKVNFYLFGLELTFTGEYFESAEYLLSKISKENIVYIPMECETPGCNNQAKYNARIVDGKIVRYGETFVADKSIYMSLCKKCFFEET